MATTFTVSPGQTITDCILAATGDISNLDLVLEQNNYLTWVPLFNGGEVLVIPDTAIIDANNQRGLAVNPPTNNALGNVYSKIDAIFALLSGYAADLQTYKTNDFTANKSSNNNIVYILEVINITDTGFVINGIAGSLFGNNVSHDVAISGFKVYRNVTPDLNGSPALFITATPAGTTKWDFAYTGLNTFISANSIRYIIIALDIDSSATTGNRIGMQGGLNPVVLTITGNPGQYNQQTNSSGIITVGT